MSYHFLTGATGLLGRYLLKDLTLAGVRLAVVVRPSRKQSAEERVESMMAYWDKVLGMELERPVVMEGDISKSDLGLSPDNIMWAAENCSSMIHNAASLSFISTSKQSEPWRSNVEGTRNVIDFCKQAGIHNFFHVSTAYVCGLREGIAKETELDVGQEWGNDYERSKVMAETLVREEASFNDPTVFRPAIIIGDSQNGFTTTFHGFYAALQLIHTLIKIVERDETGFHDFRQARLNLDGTESKNLIPVDWVSEVMTHIITTEEHHGDTYHLTPRHPVTTRLLNEVLAASSATYGVRLIGANQTIDNPSEIEQLFYEQIKVYDSYWRDDPRFDFTNTQNAAPHLPCPHIDMEMLLKLSQAAVKMNFSWKDQPVSMAAKVAN